MNRLLTFVHFIDAINERMGKTVSYLLIPLAGVVIAEVVLRYFFNSPTIWSFELARHIFGGFIVLSGGYVLLRQAHVKIDLLYGRLSLRGRAIVDLCTAFFFFLFCGTLLWTSAGFAWTSMLLKETSESMFRIVLWPVKSAIFLGALLIVLQGIAQFIRNLHIAIAGKDWNRQ